MNEVNKNKLDKNFQILKNPQKLKFLGNLSEKLKCKRCEQILIDGCQIKCGCRFCRICINEMIENGLQRCPGLKSECQLVELADMVTDYRANMKVTKLMVKCPQETCFHECRLMDLDEHLRLCSKYTKRNKNEELISNKKCESQQFSINRPNEILMTTIDNIINDINILKTDSKRNKLEIELLNEIIIERDDKIQSLNEEIKIVKREKYELQQSVDFYNQNLENKINELISRMEMKNNETIELINNEIKLMKIVEEKLKHQILHWKPDSDSKTKEISTIENSLINRNCQNLNVNNNVEKFEQSKEILENRIKDIEANLYRKIDGTFLWIIDEVLNKRNVGSLILSDHFYGIMKPYQMQIAFWTNGRGEICGTGLSLYLRINSSSNDKFLKWPFQAEVTITIINNSCPNISQTLTKSCNIDKPTNNSYKNSDAFSFLYSDLINAGLLKENQFTVQCLVKLK